MTATITDRQAEILARHANGQTLGEIARAMYLSYITVRKDVEKAKKRLNGSVTLAQVVALALINRQIVYVGRKFLSAAQAAQITGSVTTIQDTHGAPVYSTIRKL